MKRWYKHFSFKNLKEEARATVFPTVDSKRRFVLIYFVRLGFLVSSRLWRDQCPRQAAALAYQTMLSIVPLLAIVLAVASALNLDFYMKKMTSFFEANLLPEVAGEVGDKVIMLVTAVNPGTLGVVGGITLLVLAITLLLTVEQVINEIFRCNKRRKLLSRIISSFLLLLLVPPLLGFSLYFTKEMVVLPHFINAGLPLLFTTLTLFLCYWLLPHTKIKIRHSLISAFLAGIFFEAVKIGFAFYARHLGSTLSYVYGTFFILPLTMVWIYLAWILFLFGAQFNAGLHEVKRRDRFSI